jgi:L-asparaginase II
MEKTTYQPVFELTRGNTVESVHYGAFAVVDYRGQMILSSGNPHTVTFLRSSAKPFQALPFIENGGHLHWGFSLPEIAILCASHSGTDEHAAVLSRMQAKISVTQDDLLCGVHAPVDEPTRMAMLARGEEPTPNRHNCSGKHTGMLAHAMMIDAPIEDYINPEHPVQIRILQSFSEMCNLEPREVDIGIDGCSAPVFAIPLWNAALGYARLCDPADLDPQRAQACRTITHAMMSHPEMVAGPGKFDTRLMAATHGKIVSKGGAEGYQQIGIMPDVIKPGSPGIGIALKISDGDRRGLVRPAVTLEILRQLNAIKPSELEDLAEFGPRLPVKNWRGLIVGEAYPVF